MSSPSSALPSRKHAPRRALRPLIHALGRLFIALLIATLLPLGLGQPARALAAGDLSVKVYVDAGRDGVDTGGSEPGLAGAAVAVYSPDDRLVALSNTNGSGAATFPGLPDGQYRVEVSPISGYAVSVPGAANTNPGLVSRVTLAGGAATVAVGVRQLTSGSDSAAGTTRSITTRVWDDLDSDGIQDADEPGVPGLTLQLLDNTGVVVQSAVAGLDGRYRFDAAPPGAGYSVRVSAGVDPAYTLTAADRARDGIDSDAALGLFPQIVASVPNGAVGANTDAVDIGLARGAVSGGVWRDLNRDGNYDPANEPRINGVTVELVQAGLVVSSTTTRTEVGEGAADGVFRFTGLPFGTYSVRIPNAEFDTGLLFGSANSPTIVGGPTATDDQATPDGQPGASDVVIGPFTLDPSNVAAGSNLRRAADFGFYKGAAGDFVWFDLNRDGTQGVGETILGVNGVSLFVDDGRGEGVANNGVRDGAELATITGNSPLTGLPGYYLFSDLPLGASYRVTLDSSNFAPGGILEGIGSSTGIPGTTIDGTPYYYFPADLSSDPTALDLDFGLTRSDIGNVVFTDQDGDGFFDVGEAPIPGVAVRLFRDDGTEVLNTTTDANGFYRLGQLPALRYYATFDVADAGAPASTYVGSPQPEGVAVNPADAALDYSDVITQVNATTWRTPVFRPTVGATNNGVDAGFYGLTTLNGRAFFDVNGNDQDEAQPEPGMRAVTVKLRRDGGDFTVVATTTTDASGAYGFADVAPGSYVVEFTNPDAEGYRFVAPNLPAAGDSLASDVIAIDGALGRTATVTITSGTPMSELDAGFNGTGRVRGRVFLDNDGSDTQTGADNNLGGATVALTVTANLPNLVATYSRSQATTTLAENYTFTNLPGGTGASYELVVTPPPPPPTTPAYKPSAADVSNNTLDMLDSDGPTITVADPAAGADLDFDQGFFQPVTITARVFEENAGDVDNQFQAGNPGIANVTVKLEDRANNNALVETGTSDAAGLVTFTVKPGSYRLNIDEADTDLAGFAPSPGHADPVTVPSLLSGGSSSTDTAGTNSFGYYKAASVAGSVFFDRDLDNLKAGEPGMQGVTVTLRNSGGVVSTTTTLTSGAYSFANLLPGDYSVEFTNPDAANFAFIAAGDSDVSTAGATNITLGYGVAESNVDAGMVGRATVEGETFIDSNANGLRDESPAEPFSGVQVTLTQNVNLPDLLSTTITRVVTTSGTGDYSFASLPGDGDGLAKFDLSFAPPTATPAWQSTIADVNNNGNDTTDSDGNLASQSLAAGATEDRDQGYYQPVAITGRVFRDSTLPLNNQWDAGEPGIGGVRVVLETVGGTPVLTQTTDTNGLVSFAAPPGSYRLNVDQASAALATFIASPGNTEPAAVTSLQTETTAPGTTNVFGYYQNVTITARVFDEQATVDNTPQSGEPGLAGVAVTLSGTETANATTDASGVASFSVQPGTYTLTVTDPAGFVRSPGNTGSASLGAVTAASGPTFFGYYKTSNIAGLAWFDSDSDGTRETGEPPMEGRTVELVGDVSGTVASSTLDATGAFSFSGIDPTGLAGGDASYKLCFELPAGLGFTAKGALAVDDNSDVNAADGCTDTFTIGSNQTVSTIDAGYIGALSVGDLVWEDLNANGLQDAGERGLAGATVTVEFTTANGVINATNPTIVVSATTTASGSLTANYQLKNLPPASGWNVVSVTAPFGYKASPSDVGGDESADSDPVGSYAQPLTASRSDLDFGFYQATSVGDRVWLDLNGNGTFDAATEVGVAGVSVELLRGGSVVATTTTGSDAQAGSYSFADVDPGTYSLRFAAPAGYTFVNDGAGAVGTDNDNDARLDGMTAEFTLGSAQARATLDAGLQGAAGVSGIAWVDANRNGVRDASDTGRLGGVQVTLSLAPALTPGAVITVTTTTAADGSYSFSGMPGGVGSLRFGRQANYSAVPANVGGDDTLDSDGPIVPLSLTSGVAQANVDQGYRTVGRTVWLPLVFGDPVRPDLVVNFTVNPASPTAGKNTLITVTVKNQGTAPASGFWVDFYINPSHAPLVNEPWNELCTLEPCFGLAWFYDGTLQPGESVTFNSLPLSTSNLGGYRNESSTWPGFFANGTNRLYALVDSWNRGGDSRDPFGALWEEDETNNRAEQSIVVNAGPLPPEYSGNRFDSHLVR